MDYADHPTNRNWSAADRIDLLRRMVRIRRFEQMALKCYIAGKMGGWLPLDIGQESVSASVRSVMGEHDHSISGFRGIGHAVAAGIPMRAIMAELYGKTNGASKGRAGVFSFFDPALRHWGSHGVAAAHTPLAAGLAFALKQREIPGAVVCFLGDGSINQGAYHESLNLAGLFGLPVVYLIENNGYAFWMSVARSSRFKECLARRAETYDIAWDRFDGGNPYEIRARVAVALERARLERRPTVVEIGTYRYHGFNVADAGAKLHRTPQEIEEHKARDPLGRWRTHLLEKGWLDGTGAEEIAEAARREAAEAADFAEGGGVPTVADLTGNVYWETDHATPASRTGRHFFDG